MNPERVLVVDDNEQNRLVAEGYLSAAGYAVELAESGASAIERVIASAPSLVLLDVLMPGMDGFEVCRMLRQLPEAVHLPIVFLTALSDLGTHRQAMESGADDFLSKPIRQTELLLRVRSLIRIHRLHRELEERNAMLRYEQEQRRRLAALVVHDLKSPLAAQLLNCEYLQRLDLPDDAREAVVDVAAATAWMQRMVLELLDIHRSEDAGLRPRLERIDARAAIAAAFAALSRLAMHVDQRLELVVEPDGLALAVDPDLFHRVMLNLFDNAQKYGPPGSVVRAMVVGVSEGGAQIDVSDAGPGIPVAQREVIFALYGRLDHEQRRPSRGLGLAFCRMAVEAHGGSIVVVEREEGGTAFRILLPGPPPTDAA